MTILRKNTATLDAAITLATNEQNPRKRFSLHTRQHYTPDDERMEVDYYRPAHPCFKCNKKCHRAKDCRARPHVNAVDNTHRNKNERDMLCWCCHRQVHFKSG